MMILMKPVGDDLYYVYKQENTGELTFIGDMQYHVVCGWQYAEKDTYLRIYHHNVFYLYELIIEHYANLLL